MQVLVSGIQVLGPLVVEQDLCAMRESQRHQANEAIADLNEVASHSGVYDIIIHSSKRILQSG